MENLKQLELPELIDMLAVETSQYMVMVKSGSSLDDFETCKEKIKKLQSEIELRKTTNQDQAE